MIINRKANTKTTNEETQNGLLESQNGALRMGDTVNGAAWNCWAFVGRRWSLSGAEILCAWRALSFIAATLSMVMQRHAAN